MRRIVLLVTTLLILSLLVTLLPACQAAPSEEETGPVEAKTVDIQYECVSTSATVLNAANYMLENLDKASDGRIQMELIIGEAVVPTDQQLEATRDGIFDMLLSWPVYFAEKIPTIRVNDSVSLLLQTHTDWWAVENGRGLGDILDNAYGTNGVKRVHNFLTLPGDGLTSTFSVPDFETLEGMKIRCGGAMGNYLEAAGASTIFLSGEEVYTALASGLVDAATYGNPSLFVKMGFPEVAKFWIMPTFEKSSPTVVLANQDFWNGLSEADETIILNIQMAAGKYTAFEKLYSQIEALAIADDLGVTINWWSADDVRQFSTAALTALKKPTNAEGMRAYDIVMQYCRDLSYID